ncbi:hypothetical protein F4808DRAFT_420436 [Astrocystis sublimbata]|nr:hypothetical protein F4808DRAFT_420436 [Astrocystis sublimbata]
MPSFRNLLKRTRGKISSSASQSSSTIAVEAAKQFLGLPVVYEDPEVTLTILAIHELDSDREKTWTATNAIRWLRGLLQRAGRSDDLSAFQCLFLGHAVDAHAPDQVNYRLLYSHLLHVRNLEAGLARKSSRGNVIQRQIILVTHDHVSTIIGPSCKERSWDVDATILLEQALPKIEKALGPEHIHTVNVVNELGNFYRKQDRYTEAESMLERALHAMERFPGPEHISTLKTVTRLGTVYGHRGRYRDAECMFERVLRGKEKMYGPEHKSTLSTIDNLAAVYLAERRYIEAAVMLKRSLRGYEKTLGHEVVKTHLPTLKCLRELGKIYCKFNNEDSARLC